MANFSPVDEQLAYIKKGAAEIIREAELRERLEKSLKTGKPLRVKAGFDPTAPDLHVGHTVLMRKLKHFPGPGPHGDLPDRRLHRHDRRSHGPLGHPPAAHSRRFDRNAETYKAQVFKILDPQKTVVDFNSRWFSKMSVEDFVRLAAKFTVSQMLEREDFHKRFQEEKPIAMHELLYPFARAMTRSRWKPTLNWAEPTRNSTCSWGAMLQKDYGQPSQIVLTMPILEGTDGVQKMSKSYGNYIGINEPPQEMYGKVMSISDELMWRYYELLTDVSTGEIEQMKAEVAGGQAPSHGTEEGAGAPDRTGFSRPAGGPARR